MVLARLVDQQIDVAEVEAAACRLDLLPVDRGLDRIGMHRFGGAPRVRQRRGPGAGVVDLTAQNQKWLAIDDQREAVIALLQVRDLGGLGRGDRAAQQGRHKRAQY